LGSAATWRERAALHREELGLHPKARNSLNAALAIESAEKGTPDMGRAAKLALHSPEKVSNEAPANLEGHSSTCDLVAPMIEAENQMEDEDAEESTVAGDWWCVATRVGMEQYLAYKNVQFRAAAERDPEVARIFENPGLWAIFGEVVSWERQVLRREARKQQWPDILRSPAALTKDEVEDLRRRLEEWKNSVELIDGNYSRATLQLVPIDLLVQQLLADALAATGELQKARVVLVEAVANASFESSAGREQFAPPRIGWDDRFSCAFTKAEQCVRFGRLSLLSAKAAVSAGPSTEYTPELRKLRDAEQRSTIEKELQTARRHLVDARKLYDEELAELAGLTTSFAAHDKTFSSPNPNVVPWPSLWGVKDAAVFRLALRCGRLGAVSSLALTYGMLQRRAESNAAYEEALREVTAMLSEASEAEMTPGLRRLLSLECQRLSAAAGAPS